jgi:hypothetical protein
MPLFWSVERDGDAVVATCPAPLEYASETRPGWMAHCAGAIRDELRLLPIPDGTVLEASVTGEAALVAALLDNASIPQAHVHAGVRLGRIPAIAAGVVQRYRRAAIADDGGEETIAAVHVPVSDGHELETSHDVSAAVDVTLAAALPAGGVTGALDLRVRFVTGAARTHGSVELIRKLIDGVCALLDAGAGIDAIEVTFVSGATAHLEIELRRMPVEPASPPAPQR